MFSCKTFIVSGVKFRSLIHFELCVCVCVCGVRVCPTFIFSPVAVHFSQYHCWRDSLLSTVCSCLLCHRLVDHRCVGLFLAFYPVLLIYISVLNVFITRFSEDISRFCQMQKHIQFSQTHVVA